MKNRKDQELIGRIYKWLLNFLILSSNFYLPAIHKHKIQINDSYISSCVGCTQENTRIH